MKYKKIMIINWKKKIIIENIYYFIIVIMIMINFRNYIDFEWKKLG